MFLTEVSSNCPSGTLQKSTILKKQLLNDSSHESDFINPFSWTKETVALAIWVEQLQRVARQSHCCVVWAQNSKRSAFQPTARVCHDDATTDFSGSMATWAVTLPFAVSTNSNGLNPWWKKGAAACDFQRYFFSRKKTWDPRKTVCWVGGSQMCFFFIRSNEASRYFEGTSGTGHYRSWHF